MSILHRFRRTSALSTDEPYYGEVVQRVSRPDEVTAYYKEMDLGQQTELIRAAAASPFTGTSDKTASIFVDPTIYRMMVSAEKMIERNGDVKEGILAKMDFASGGLIVSHSDPGVQQKYKEFFDRVDMNALVEDTWLTEEIYANAYLVSALVGGNVSFFALNPKRTAVGRQLSVGGRPINSPRCVPRIVQRTTTLSSVARAFSAISMARLPPSGPEANQSSAIQRWSRVVGASLLS